MKGKVLNVVKKDCCSKCGFPKEIERKPIILSNSVLSYIEYEENTCKECGHQKDGSTIPVVWEHWQSICRNFIKEREDLIKFMKHYSYLDEDDRKQVCVTTPRFMLKDYVTPEGEDLSHGDVEEPFSWNAVHLEVIEGTRLSKVLVRDIKWDSELLTYKDKEGRDP